MYGIVLPVVQLVEQNVEGVAALKAILLWQQAVVGVVEGPREAPKHAGNGQIKLVVAVEGGWVISHCSNSVSTQVIPIL
jgi:hypothetical protein